MNESYGHRYVLRRMNYYDYSFFFLKRECACTSRDVESCSNGLIPLI